MKVFSPIPTDIVERARKADAVKQKEAELLKALKLGSALAHESNSIRMMGAGGVQFVVTIYGETTSGMLRSICTLLEFNAQVIEGTAP